MKHVVIVGAGPVGLWLAAELRLRDVPVVLLEARDCISPHSKALTIHPRTLELLAQRGLIDRFLAGCPQIPTGHFGGLESRLDFSVLDTPYPFTLLQPQAQSEQLLEENAVSLGAELLRGHRMSGFTEGADSLTVCVHSADGDYSIEAAYLVGCDGARSTVRKAAGIDFPGTPSTLYGMLGDVVLDDPPDPMFTYSGSTGQMMILDIGGGTHRIVGIDPLRCEPMDHDLTFEEFRESVIRVVGTDYGMHSPTWISRYGNAARLAERYRSGRVLLAGDAAHMHFPAGGVGMNVGLQDAHALGWRLADVLVGWAADEILDDYGAERRAVGQDLLRATQAQSAVLAAFAPDARELRGLLNELIVADPTLSRLLAERLSGLSVAYPGPRSAHPLVGTRAIPARSEGVVDVADIRDAERRGLAVLRLPVALVEAASGPAAAIGVTVVADDTAVAMLVRPDGYVAWASEAPDRESVSAALHAFRPSMP